MAPPPPTPIALPVALHSAPARGKSRAGLAVLVCALAVVCAGGAYVYDKLRPRETAAAGHAPAASAPPMAPSTPAGSAASAPAPSPAPSAPAAPQPSPAPSQSSPDPRLLADLHGNDDDAFQAAWATLNRQAANADALSQATSEYAAALNSSAPQPERRRALRRLKWLAQTGDGVAAQRVAAFEQGYDTAKQSIATSAWWARGEGDEPDGAARWVADGQLLAEGGDRPAMLDVAFALGHGRALPRDGVAAVQMYLRILARSEGDDPASRRIHQAAAHGAWALLDGIVRQRDGDAAQRLRPVLRQRADAGAADIQYYLGLMSECAQRPADLRAARQWYRLAAQNPEWKRTVQNRLRQLGRNCPG